MDLETLYAEREIGDAKLNALESFASGSTPEQAAIRIRKARTFQVPYAAADEVTPEEMARRQAESIQWADLYARAPVLVRAMGDPAYANLVRDDVESQGLIEAAVWKLSPEVDKVPQSAWQAARNSGARGAYSFFGNERGLKETVDELKRLDDIQNRISSGEDDASIFGTPEDPLGVMGRRLYEKQQAERGKLYEQLDTYAKRTARATRMRNRFPQSEAGQRFGQEDTLRGALSAFFDDPLMVLADIGPESLTQYAPAMAAATFLGPLGGLLGGSTAALGTVALTQGITSFNLSRSSNFAERLGELGVDFTDEKQVEAYFANPGNWGAIEETYRLATEYAGPIAVFDALSVGLASKSLVPKSLFGRALFGGSMAKREFANMGAQSVLQGAMGGAGEAAGQFASDGQITSWSDVVAEVIGEQFTAPVEVASTGLRVRFEADRERAVAERKAQQAKQMAAAIRASKSAPLDPESQMEQIHRVGEAAGVSTVTVDGQAFFQRGLDKRFSDMPDVVERMREAAETGQDAEVPIETYAAMAARAEDDSLIEITSFGGTPSLADATAEAQSREQAAVDQTTRAVDEMPDADFKSEVADIGREVGAQLREAGIVRDEAFGIQAVIQAFVASAARDAGVSPRALWNELGFSIESVNEPGGETRGAYLPDARMIRRWKNADRSTLIHEVGHAFLDMRLKLAERMQAEADAGTAANPRQAAFLEDAKTLLDWLGVKDFASWGRLTGEERTAAHERFARSFEAYIAQGRAPNARLAGAFSNLSRLLAGTYQAAEMIPGASVNPETSAMFDAFFASREQVGRAAMRSPAGRILADERAAAALTPEEAAEARQAFLEADQEAMAEQIERNRRNANALHRLRNRILRDIKAGTREQVNRIKERLKRTRPYRAWEAVKNGIEHEGEKIYLKPFAGDLEALGCTSEQIDYLHKKGLVTKQRGRQPMSADAVAESLGYANGREMADDLIRVADAAEWLDEQAATELMKEDPDAAKLLDPKEQDARADAAVYNKARERILETELKALGRLARREARNLAGTLRAAADRVVEALPVRDLKPQKYINAARRASREAQAAFAAGDYMGAFEAKRREIWNAALARRVKETATRFAKKRAALDKYTKSEIKSMDGRFLETIQRALAQLGIYTLKRLKLNPATEAFSKTLDNLAEETGYSFDASPEVVAAITTGDASHLETVRGMQEFFDLVDELDARGRKEKEIGVGEAKAELEAVQNEVADNLIKVADERGRGPRAEQGIREREGPWQRLKDSIAKFGIHHARMAAIAAVLDGGWTGPLARRVIYPADRAAAREESMMHDATKRLFKIFKPVMKGFRERRTSQVMGRAFTVGEVFFTLLNYGNEGNRIRAIRTVEKLTGRNLRGEFDPNNQASVMVAEERADAAMRAFWAEYLTDAHYKAAEQVWALFADMQKETGKVARRITGRTPLWVEPRKLTVATENGFRELAGGYYPIRYDRELSAQGAEAAAITQANDMRPFFAKGGVNDGHLQRRMRDNVNPLALTTRALGEGLQQQIHYIAWAETLNDFRKIFGKRGRIANAIMERYGANCKQAIDNWLQACRTGSTENAYTDTWADFLRRGVSVASIGFNVVTAVVQLTGATQSVAYLGPKWAARGLGEFMRMGPRKAIQYVHQISPQMAARTRTMFREVAEVQGRLNGTRSAFGERFQQAAYVMVTAVQSLVDIPTWLGAYEKALSEGKSETLARDEADRAVMNSQGSGRITDLSAHERGSAVQRLFTVFYTFFNTALNMAVVSGRTEKGMKRAMQILTVLVMQPVLEAFLRGAVGQIGKDDDDWVEKTIEGLPANIASFNLGMIFGLREASSFFDGYQYSGPTGLRKITDAGKFGDRLMAGKLDEKTLRAGITAVGSWTGLPAVPINRMIQGYGALESGETDNPLVMLTGWKKE